MKKIIYQKIASFLDPNTLKYLSEEQISEAEKNITKHFTGRNNTQSQRKSDEKITPCVEAKVLAEFATMCGLTSSKDGNSNLTIKQELTAYQFHASRNTTEKYDFQHIWHQHATGLPKLAGLVRRYNCIPATSVPCESSFSIAGYINRKERSSMSSRSLRYSMCLLSAEQLKKVEFDGQMET